MSGSFRGRSQAAGVLACAATLMLGSLGRANTGNDPRPQTPAAEQVPVEVFTAPQPKKIPVPDCDVQTGRGPSGACGALHEGSEGWVELNFMVDPQGKPFDITVVRSTGNKLFEQTAMKVMASSTFEPGTLNGKPIESGFEMKYKFLNEPSSSGASLPFVREYKALMRAVESSDRDAADEALHQLKVTNLYEDAYFGLAMYTYAKKWGDESQQLEGIERAVAEEDHAQYLPKDLFRTALFTRLGLELNTSEYAEAMTTWTRLKKLGVDKEMESRIQPVIDKLERLRSDDTRYAVNGQMPDGRWFLHLFKRHFQAEVTAGFISQVKLRCDKHWVDFNFDPTLEYQVPSAYGNCTIELQGAPQTKFKLVQF
jgi:TonB family protein